MNYHRTVEYFMAGTLLAAPLMWCATAQDNPTAATSAPARNAKAVDSSQPAAAADQALDAERTSPAPLSPSVAEVLKMLAAGVSKDVVKVYVENAAVTSDLTASDLIALKQHGVTDDITTALVKRGAELRAQANNAAAASGAAAANQSPPAKAAAAPSSGYLDPESHDFWFYYYAYPRALAYANQRMYGYYPGVGFGTPYAYGYYPGVVYNAYAPAYFGRPGPVGYYNRVRRY